jgi:hypothetical protein
MKPAPMASSADPVLVKASFWRTPQPAPKKASVVMAMAPR